MNKYILFLIIIVLFGCGSGKSISEKDEKIGYVVGTFTIIDEKPRFDSYSLHYKHKGKKINFFSNYKKITVSTKMPWFKRKFSPDYSIEKKRVHIFIKKHKAGEYEFFNYDLFTNLGLIQSNMGSKEDFSLPFKVSKDSISYIGNITFYPKGNENGNLFVLKDNYEKDIAAIKEKYPTMNWEVVQNKTIKEGDLENSSFELK